MDSFPAAPPDPTQLAVYECCSLTGGAATSTEATVTNTAAYEYGSLAGGSVPGDATEDDHLEI
jgi:hypothetical protein